MTVATTKETKAISLANELVALEGALEAAELIADMMATEGMPDVVSQARAPMLVAAVLDMALGRVRLLRRVVLQQADPLLLAGRYNVRRGRTEPWEEPDIFLKSEARPKPKRSVRKTS